MVLQNQVRFESKEEANERRLEEVLSRTPHERLILFLKMIEEMQIFKNNDDHPNRTKNNFVIE